jgi:replicative DNA helicase
MLDLHEQGLSIDTVIVGDQLERNGRLEEWGGRVGLQAVRNDFRGDQPESYAWRVLDYAAKRKMIEEAGYMATWSNNGRKSDVIRDDIIRRLTEIKTPNVRGDQHLSNASAELSKYYDRVDRAATIRLNGGTIDWLIPTGFIDLDKMYDDGLEESDFVILAGRPGTGKSSMLLSMAKNITQAGRRVLFCGLEMGNEQTIGRLVSMETGIPYGRTRSGKLTENEWPIFTNGIETLDGLPLELIDLSAITVNQIRQAYRKIEATKGKVDLIMVDYLQLGGADGKFSNRQEEVSSISKGMKAMALEFNVPVVAAAQLSRAVEQRASKKPILSDLRESGSLEQDADSVWFIYNENDIKSDMRNQVELIVAKHRNGAVGSVDLIFIPSKTKFENATVRNFAPERN